MIRVPFLHAGFQLGKVRIKGFLLPLTVMQVRKARAPSPGLHLMLPQNTPGCQVLACQRAAHSGAKRRVHVRPGIGEPSPGKRSCPRPPTPGIPPRVPLHAGAGGVARSPPCSPPPPGCFALRGLPHVARAASPPPFL